MQDHDRHDFAGEHSPVSTSANPRSIWSTPAPDRSTIRLCSEPISPGYATIASPSASSKRPRALLIVRVEHRAHIYRPTWSTGAHRNKRHRDESGRCRGESPNLRTCLVASLSSRRRSSLRPAGSPAHPLPSQKAEKRLSSITVPIHGVVSLPRRIVAVCAMLTTASRVATATSQWTTASNGHIPSRAAKNYALAMPTHMHRRSKLRLQST